MIAVVPFFLQNFFQSFLVVAEKPKMGLIVSVCAGLANMIFDFLFIYVFKMGVSGAAIATVIGQIIGGIIPLVYFCRKNDSPLKLTKAKFDKSAVWKTCSNGSSEMLSHISMSLVNILYNMQLMKFAGADGVVAYGIIMYVDFMFVATYLGYSLGSAPIISYHYGAENKDELKNLVKKSLKLVTIASIVMTLIAELLAKPLANIFVGYSESLLEMTTNAMRIFFISFLISGLNIFTSSLFTALNNGLISAIVSFLRTLVFQVSMIFLLPQLLGLNGIWLAIVVADILALIVSAYFFIRNKSKYEYI